jgi:hypothetical protein
MCSAYDDVELLAWLRWAEKHGTNFLRKLAEAAMIADVPHYRLLRSALIAMKKEFPQQV